MQEAKDQRDRRSNIFAQTSCQQQQSKPETASQPTWRTTFPATKQYLDPVHEHMPKKTGLKITPEMID